MKKVLAIILLAALCLSLVACGGKSFRGVEGKWECSSSYGDYVMTLNKGGKGTMVMDGKSYECTWEFDSKSNFIAVTLNGNTETGTYMEDSDTLYIDSLKFTRAK
jgi:hypothetical protein